MKSKILVLGMVLVGSVAQAGKCDSSVSFGCGYDGPLSSSTVTLAPTMVLGATSNSFQLVKNDLMQVKGDAVVAKETGFVSAELESVIVRVREIRTDLATASDEEIIDLIIKEN